MSNDLTGYAPDGYYDPEEVEPGRIIDHDDPRTVDLDEFAEELMAAYDVAIDANRDAAQQARAGGNYARRAVVPMGPRDLATTTRRNRRDRAPTRLRGPRTVSHRPMADPRCRVELTGSVSHARGIS